MRQTQEFKGPKEQNYLALDLELNKGETGSGRIIQVGVAYGNFYSPKLETRSWYLDPKEPIDPFITKLTGINDEDISAKAVPHEQVLNELTELISAESTFVNPVTWGQGDSDELLTEFRQAGLQPKIFGRRILDVKTLLVYHEISKGMSGQGGLARCMRRYNLDFQGLPHRADFDALNTLRFFFYFVKRMTEWEKIGFLIRKGQL
jgi:DNA polymerase III epsilon subunit-like protein